MPIDSYLSHLPTTIIEEDGGKAPVENEEHKVNLKDKSKDNQLFSRNV